MCLEVSIRVRDLGPSYIFLLEVVEYVVHHTINDLNALVLIVGLLR